MFLTTMTNEPKLQHIWLFCGYAGSGKDTAAVLLASLVPCQRNSFAGAVKDEVSILYEFERAYLDTEAGKNRLIKFADGTFKTVRQLIIDHAESQKQETGNPAYWAEKLQAPTTPHWILSDWRFLAELASFRTRFPDAKIHTVRVVRPGVEPLATHTEHELDGFGCEHLLQNSGSLLYLSSQLKELVEICNYVPRERPLP